MKIFLIKCTRFILWVVTIFIVLNYVLDISDSKDDRFAWKYDEVISPKVNADIVVFGSSKALRGISPKEMEKAGTSVYNFGFPGANPEFIYKWYTKLFKQYYKKPKNVVLEVSWLMFNENWMWRRFEQDSKYFTVKDYMAALYQSKDKKTLFYNRYPIFNYSLSKNADAEKFVEGDCLECTYNGHTPYTITKSKTPFAGLKPFDPEKQRAYLKLLLQEFEKDAIEVVMVCLPELNDTKYNYVTQNIQFLEELANTFELKFINYQKEFKQCSLFYDWSHLNSLGAKLISEKLIEDLK